jgi:hypothetical protein
VGHGRYLLFEWPARAARTPRVPSTYAVRRGGPTTFNTDPTPTCSCHLWTKRSSLMGAPERPRDFPNGMRAGACRPAMRGSRFVPAKRKSGDASRQRDLADRTNPSGERVAQRERPPRKDGRARCLRKRYPRLGGDRHIRPRRAWSCRSVAVFVLRILRFSRDHAACSGADGNPPGLCRRRPSPRSTVCAAFPPAA